MNERMSRVVHRVLAILCAVMCGAWMASASAEEVIPKHIQLGRDLVQNIKPENNEYSNSRRHVRFPGDLFSSGYTVYTDCTGFVEAMLDRAYGFSPSFSTKTLKDRFSVIDYVDGIERSESFTRVTRVDDLRVGDVVAWKFLKKVTSKRVNGHIMMVNGAPRKLETSRRAGLVQWEVPVIDSSSSPKSPDDTRLVSKSDSEEEDATHEGGNAGKQGKRTGAGAGRVSLYSDENGNLVAMSFGFHNSKIFKHGESLYYVMGRLPEKAARK